MTHEAINPSQPFANKYPMPGDQLAFQFDLQDSFARDFPDSAPLIHQALADVQRFSGIDIPKYQFVETLSGDYPGPDDIDELGFLSLGSGGDNGYTMLALTMPAHHSDEEIAQMTEEERTEASKTHEGFLVVGDIPPETSAMLNGVYGLIGADTIRDDRTAGEDTGTVLRRGEYQGTVIYIAEDYMNHSYYSGKPMMSVSLVGRDMSESIATGLNNSQFKEFVDAVGQSPSEAQQIMLDNKVTSNNYEDVGDALRQAREIVDTAGPDVGRQTLGDSIDEAFRELGIRVEGRGDELPKFDRSQLPLLETDAQGNIKITPELKKWIRIQKLPLSIRNIGRTILHRLHR